MKNAAKQFGIVGISMVAGQMPKVSQSEHITHPSYDYLGEDHVSEYGFTAYLYKHKKSGAEILSITADDDNKVFGVTFRTPPEDSTGVPHILEHSVLCGSRKYPLKEPFVDLLKGSLQTFLNAFTYPDRTCYPVASQNTKDFYNLINVYLDAVFFPRAISDPMVLAQEGWHYEADSTDAPLNYKGVVFNEMKGVYSSPDSLHSRICQQALFPDNTYGVDSGGDPLKIPNLTFDYFKSFHQKFYHPANSRVYFYGDDPIDKRLELLDEYLREFDVGKADIQASTIQWQKKFSEPRKETSFFAANEDSMDKHMISVNWLLNDKPMSSKDKLVLNILDDLLVGNNAALMKKELTDSGYGSSVIGGGLSDELLQATWSIGLKGVSPENVDKVEELILRVLKKCAEDGFEESAIAASLNSVEFELREFNTGSFPRGLSLMLNAVSNWIYDFAPTSDFHFEAPLSQLKEELARGVPVFQNMLKELLVQNGHRITVEMKPSTKYAAELEAEERAMLDAAKSTMSEMEVAKVIEETEKLKLAQAAEDSPEAKATIPSLTIADLDKKVKNIPIHIKEYKNVKVITHPISSSGIVYADIGFDLTGVSLSEYPLIGLLSRMLLETGAGRMDRVELTRHINTQTGGLYCSSLTGTKQGKGGIISSTDDMFGYLFLRGKAVSAKTPELMEIVRDVVMDAKLDSQQRAIEILKESKAMFESSIIGSGHSYASARINARYTVEGYLNEISGGISSYELMKEFLKTAETDWPALLSRLEALRLHLVKKENLIVNLTGDEEVLERAEPAVYNFIDSIPADSALLSLDRRLWNKESKLLPLRNEGFAVQTQVNYVGKGGRLFEPGERVPGNYQVVSRFLRTGYLWDNVRVMGGAYGGFCQFNPFNGIFTFLSYRDPNLMKTIQIYDNCADYLKGLHLTSEELELSVIGTVGDMDSPQSADQKGFTSLKRYLMGIDDDERQRIRDEILSTKPEDFSAFGDRLFELNSKARSAVVSSKSVLEIAQAEIPDGADPFVVKDI